jgi:NIMA-interacting peptidyl-prolyl cis-trans isomerase 1
VRLSNSRDVPYFYNTETQQSTWEKPEELTEEEIKALPGASLLEPKEVRASHILVKHSGSRRPSSWKEASRSSLSRSR